MLYVLESGKESGGNYTVKGVFTTKEKAESAAKIIGVEPYQIHELEPNTFWKHVGGAMGHVPMRI